MREIAQIMKGKNLALILALSTSFLVQGATISHAEEIQKDESKIENEESPSYKKPENLEEAQKNYNDAKDDLDKNKENLDQKQEEANTDQESLEKLQSEKENQEEKKNQATENIEKKVEEEKKEKSDALDEAIAEEKKAQDTSDEAKKSEEKAKADLEDIKSKAEETDANLKEAQKENPDIEDKINKAESELEEAEKDYHKSWEKLTNVDTDLNKSYLETRKLNEKKQNLEHELKRTKQNIEHNQKAQNQIIKDIEDLEAEINELANSQDYEKILDEKHKELNSLKSSIIKIEKKRDELQNKINSLHQELEELSKSIDDEKLNSLRSELKSKEEELKKLNDSLNNNNNSQDEKSKEIKELNDSITALKDEIRKNNSKIKDNEYKIGELENELSPIISQIQQKKVELEFLGGNKDSKPTPRQIEYAQAQWDRGSIGFFEKMGSKDVIKVFESVTDKHEGKDTAKVYLEENKIKDKLDPSDSRTLENMYQAVMDIGKINDKRLKDKGIDGRILKEMKVTDYYMAIAQANANYSYVFDRGHVDMFEQSENLAWGPREIDSALERWWDDEKKIFDYLRGLGITNVNDMNNYIYDNQAEIKDEFGKIAIGHYLNLVDDGWFSEDGTGYRYDNLIMGYAVRPGDYGYVNSMVATELDSDKAYTVEEYKNRFLEYYNNLKDIIDGKKAPVRPEDEDKIKKLRAEIEELNRIYEDKYPEIVKLRSDNAALDKNNWEKDKLIKSKNRRVSILNDEINGLIKEKNNLDKQIYDTKIYINRLNSKISSSLLDSSKHTDEILKIKEQISKTGDELNSLAYKLRSENNKKQLLDIQINNINNSINRQKNEINKLTIEKQDRTQYLEHLKRRKNSDSQKVVELNKKIDEITPKIKESEMKTKTLEHKRYESKNKLEEKNINLNKAKEKLDQLEKSNEEYSDLKTKAEEASKAFEKAKEDLDKAKTNKDEAQKSLEEAQNKVADAKAAKEEAYKLDPKDFASLGANEKFAQDIKDYEDATKALENLDKPLKEVEEKLAESQKNLDEARQAYRKSLARFKVAEADLMAFKKPDDESNDKDDPADIPERDFDHKDSDLEDEKEQNAKLSGLYQAVIRNKILTEAARTLLRIAPEKVSDIKVELKNIIDKSKELTSLAEVELIGFYSLLEKDENYYLVDQKYSNVISINDILYGKYEDFNFDQNNKEKSELDKLKQTIIKNKIMIKAAKVLLELAPEKVSIIRPQLLKIIEESNQLVKLGQNILIENGYKIK